jgi:molybdate transport system substrate-binding protein
MAPMTTAGPDSSGALRVLCARALTDVANTVARDFTAGSGVAVDIVFGTVGALQARLDAGAIADVVILSASAIERLMTAGYLDQTSSRAVGSTGIGVAVRAGAARPDITTPEAFKQTLIDARAIAFSDPAVGGSAGVYLAGLFGRLGMTELIGKNGLPQQSGGEVARRVAEGVADIGLTQVSEMLMVNGISVVGTLPAPLGNDTLYCAAVRAGSALSAVAHALIAALTAPDARRLLAASGFEPPREI